MKNAWRAVGAVVVGVSWVACSSAGSLDGEDTSEVELAVPAGPDAGPAEPPPPSPPPMDAGAPPAPASPCSCPVGAGEYLPAGVENPCPAEDERTSCQAEMCTVAIGDPNDDQADFWELRACKWPPPPPNPPGLCSCPVGAGEYLPDDPDSNDCPSNDDRNSCQVSFCTVMVGDPSDGLYDAIAIRTCTWPPPPPNPVGPCMCPVGPNEYLPDGQDNDCPGADGAGACGASWCTVAMGDPGDSEADFWELRPCNWVGPAAE